MTASAASSPTMIKLKSKQQKPEVSPETSLADRIRETCRLAEDYIESKVDTLKASEEGRLLPRDWLRSDLRGRHGGHCHCRVALSLLEKENG